MAKTVANLDNEETLADIKSLDDAFKALAAAGIATTEVKDLGSGFVILKEKDQLVGKPILVVKMDFHDSDKFGKDGKFVSLYVVAEDGGKYIINDGSTGIMRQCEQYASRGITAGIIIREGLTRSDYEKEVTIDGKTQTLNATTYYLAST